MSDCAAPTCTRPATRGLLCADDHERLGQQLADLAGDLTAHTAPTLTGWRVGAHGTALASERDPINFRQLDAQTQAPPVLAAWADWVSRTHPRRPARRGGAAADRSLLARHYEWITVQPEVVEFVCQIRGLWSSLRGHLPARQCTCGGPVWVDRGGGWCSWCSTAWTGRELLELPKPAGERMSA